MKYIKNISLLFLFSLVFSEDVLPLSSRPFDVNSSGLIYGRGTYLIVLPQNDIESYLVNENYGGDFVKFKKTQGYDVEIMYYDQIASDALGLKQHIMNYYNENPMLEYVLLVGDVNGPYTIPTFTINSYNEEDIDVTDYPYTFTDDSYEPKFFIGRWTIRSVVDFINVKSRTIQYTRNDYIDNDIFNNALLVAGNYKTAEGVEVPPNEWPVTPVWTSLWLYDELGQYGYAQIDTAFFHAGNYETAEYNPLIANTWNSGVGVINYRGWGDANGWHKPYFHREEVEDLSNGWRMPIVMSFVCNTGDFGNDYSGTGLSKCFGEVLITGGSVVNPKGATAVVGPSDLDTDTRFNNVICGVMWDGLLEGKTPELGQALHYGKQSLITEFSGLSAPDGTIIDEFYHHVYGVLGDPSIPVILEEPKDIVVNSDSDLHESYISIYLEDNLGIPIDMVVGALLDSEGELIAKGISNNSGHLFIDFESVSFGNSLMLYLNKAQYKQHEIIFNYIEDLGNSIDVDVSLDIISSIENSSHEYIVPGGSINIDLKYSNLSNYEIESADLIIQSPSNDVVVPLQSFALDLNSFSDQILYGVEIQISSDYEIGNKIEIESILSAEGYDITSNNIFIIVSSNENMYPSSDPTPPCDYGYWAYDNTDEGFSTNVLYDWIEINEIGENLNLSDDTMYNNLDIGFNFKYFGLDYNQINVCSNGWISFEPTTIDYFWNFSIPNPLGPSAMIAPFMDDLDDNNGTEPFNVFYYNDNNEKFIIQWDDVSNGEDDQDCPNCIKETFQLILYNEETFPTSTGDGEILFQYKEVYDIDQNGNYSTIGIESQEQDDGVQYLFSTHEALGSAWEPNSLGKVSDLAIKFTTNSPNYSSGGGCVLMDINQDGFINVVDIVQLVNIIFEIFDPSNYELCASDINGDGIINVVDIVTLVNYILSS